MFIRHTPCIWPDTFTKRRHMMFNRIRTKRKRAVPFNWIMLFWSVSILRGVFPYEPLLVFGSCQHTSSNWNTRVFHSFWMGELCSAIPGSISWQSNVVLDGSVEFCLTPQRITFSSDPASPLKRRQSLLIVPPAIAKVGLSSPEKQTQTLAF